MEKSAPEEPIINVNLPTQTIKITHAKITQEVKKVLFQNYKEQTAQNDKETDELPSAGQEVIKVT